MGPSISLKWTPHVVYKDEMGIFYTKPEMIIDCGTPIYRVSLEDIDWVIHSYNYN